MKKIMYFFIFMLYLVTISTLVFASTIHHEVQVLIEPTKHSLTVSDVITIPAEYILEGEQRFLLHGDLVISDSSGVILSKEKAANKGGTGLIGCENDLELPDYIPLNSYLLNFEGVPDSPRKIRLEYSGHIYHPVEQTAAEYARSFSETPGIICEEGVFLSASSFWLAWFGDTQVTFELDIKLPQGWDAVSQGRRTIDKNGPSFHRAGWKEMGPQEDVYLIAAPFTRYEVKKGPVSIMAYLRTPDPNLAEKYIQTTGQYLNMYQQLIGPFPYSKFALVENFWETGYGMPSFTLLGPQVIRFPFILHSSYPHELLHNWWGNSVYVDYDKGNWCEGMTVYMADHLIKEQRGQGDDYRRTSLQKFTDYVTENNDFPLKDFLSRTSAHSEAIGYGKSMMLVHMLRMKFGDDQFRTAIQLFYKENRWKKASFEDLQIAFSTVTGEDLSGWFEQWLDRTGAPELELSKTQVEPADSGYTVTLTLEQVQPEAPFMIDVPIVCYGEGEHSIVTTTVRMSDRVLTTTLTMPTRPLLVEIDPNCDVFRRLHRNEIPPSLSQVFGAETVAIVLPAKESTFYAAYRTLAETWSKDQGKSFTILEAGEQDLLPKSDAVWIFGLQNRFRELFVRAVSDYNVELSPHTLTCEGTTLPLANNSFVLVGPVPEQPDQVMAWLFTDNKTAPAGLARKLPHYGKYSYLAFEGDEPTNIAKGQWPIVNSPLTVKLAPAGEAPDFRKPTLPQRSALAELPPVFSKKDLLGHIHYLASEELGGRGLGTEELDQAADYIATRFQQIGLVPGGFEGSFFQTWTETVKNRPDPFTLKNVIGVIKGTKKEWSDQSVVVCAHYDHLGKGWPDVHKGDEGLIHPGADDNASGVSVMIELARHFAAAEPPDRSLVFVAFSGEESGRLGSKHFIESMKTYSPDKIVGVINLDSVGRLGHGKILVLGSSSAREWRHIFMGCSYVTGVPSEIVMQDLDASDQQSFIEKGIPAVQLFTGPHQDYHRPGDTIDKIDGPGLVRVASLTREAILYLTQREENLTVTSPQVQPPQKSGRHEKTRSVSTGTMPDFTFAGKGYRIGGVTPGSPAEKAGLLEGDIIIQVDAEKINSLKDYSRILKTYEPGDNVTITYIRDEQQSQTRLVLEQR